MLTTYSRDRFLKHKQIPVLLKTGSYLGSVHQKIIKYNKIEKKNYIEQLELHIAVKNTKCTNYFGRHFGDFL